MDFKTYAKSYQSNISLELARVEKLLEKCSYPDKDLKIIHIAGTNGKGSVSSFIAKGLEYMGEKCGKFSSPELYDITDTISVNGQNITVSELDKIYSFLEPLCDEVFAEIGERPSQFEINFVASLLFFKSKNCTHAVIECGMGGLGDATNAIGDSCVCVITKISLDHMTYLGDSLDKIAENKCGIFKKSSKVFSTPENAPVMHIIEEKAEKNSFEVCNSLDHKPMNDMHSIVQVGEKWVKLSLKGTHQVYNASLASAVLSYLGADEQQIAYALSNAKNRARCEFIKENICFDGAHNPDGVKVLVDSINSMDIKGKVIFITGFMKDKDYKNAFLCLKNLKVTDFEIYTVNVNSNPRSEKSEILKSEIEKLGFKATSFTDVNTALDMAEGKADFIFIFGSLYLYKEIKRR